MAPRYSRALQVCHGLAARALIILIVAGIVFAAFGSNDRLVRDVVLAGGW